tara:strand:- start:10433 stop:10774 length:342 start_codon:yes stop_codon:yes gene_type:complete
MKPYRLGDSRRWADCLSLCWLAHLQSVADYGALFRGRSDQPSRNWLFWSLTCLVSVLQNANGEPAQAGDPAYEAPRKLNHDRSPVERERLRTLLVTSVLALVLIVLVVFNFGG